MRKTLFGKVSEKRFQGRKLSMEERRTFWGSEKDAVKTAGQD